MYTLVEEHEDTVRIGYDKDLRAVIITWLKNDNELFRPMLEGEIRLVNEHDLRTLIVDTSGVKGVLTDANQDWLATDFMPRLGATGLQVLVSVVPRSAIALLVNRRSFGGTDHGLTMLEVRDVDEAHAIAARVAAGKEPTG